MKPHFSEFTYGYTLVDELSKTTQFKAVPTFPSLIEEGKEGGYDVAVNISGLPIFIQFKRSYFLSKANAKYYNLFQDKYYRFNLHALKYSQQHNLLMDLEKSGNAVFYVAPKFHSQKSLEKYYFSSNIVSNSIWISPLAIGMLPDKKEHSICFTKSGSKVYFCSEPRPIEKLSIQDYKNLSNYIFQRFNEQKTEDNRAEETSSESEPSDDSFNNLWNERFNNLETILRARQPALANRILDRITDKNIVLKTAKIARIGFGLEMLLFGPPKKE